MRSKLLVYSLIFLFFLVSYGVFQYFYSNLIPDRASLLIKASPSAVVILNEKTLGTTPYQKPDLKSGDYTLKLLADPISPNQEKRSFQKKVKLEPASHVVVNWEFGATPLLSSGEVLTSGKGSNLVVVSEPEGAVVILDGRELGLSPLSAIPTQGVHQIEISKEGFMSRYLKVDINNGLKLTIFVNLAAIAKPGVKNLEETVDFNIIHLYPQDPRLLSDLPGWSESINLKESGVDFLLGTKGELFVNKESLQNLIKTRSKLNVGYLAGKEVTSTTEEAKKVLEELKNSAKVQGSKDNKITIEISQTPTGFLNVRQSPSTSSKILTTVAPGEKYELLEERSGWFRIGLKDGVEGWIYSQYTKKV